MRWMSGYYTSVHRLYLICTIFDGGKISRQVFSGNENSGKINCISQGSHPGFF